jgi:hypothetical protein
LWLKGFLLIKETTTGAHLCEEVKKMLLQSLSTLTQKQDGRVTNGTQSMAGRNSGVSSNVTDKHGIQRFTIFNTTFIDTQRISVWKIPQIANVVTAVSKLDVTVSKGMNHR